MEKKTTIYTALTLLLGAASCSQEGPAEVGHTDEDAKIYFRSYLPSVSETRAGVVTNDNLDECFVTCFNPAAEDSIDKVTNELRPYFPEKCFSKHSDGHFLAEEASVALWPNSRDLLHFFAFRPSASDMKRNIDSEGFSLVNPTYVSGSSPLLQYRMECFKVAKDIAEQVDFIAAYTSASQQEAGINPMPLNFGHQLARIELSAWGASEKYDFEIAGVRIGNPVTEADFNFAALMPESVGASAWTYNKSIKPSCVEHIFAAGESLVVVSKERQMHSSVGDAASIMGSAGPAMVIPMAGKIDAWEGKADPKTEEKDYSTDKLYFSVLLRVINRSGETVYPYPNNCDFIPVTYLAVDGEGKVVRRVYMFGDKYYTAEVDAEDESLLYIPSGSEEIRGYCWAALPVTGGAKWEAGKIYSYKLNYTKGIGWQDPEDPTPGDPIIERGLVPFEVSVAEWVEAEGHDPDLDVPRR